MNSVALTWIDLRRRPSAPGLFDALSSDYPATRIGDADSIVDAVRSAAPRALCVEFDHPEAAGLKALQATLARFPALPLLMLSEHHSERLAVWAFRSGVRDYLVTPITAGDLNDAVDALLHTGGEAGRLQPPIPTEDCLCTASRSRIRTEQAAAYVRANIDKKIALGTLANLCHMSESQFSRQFKREQGVTLREFILRTRMERAREILRSADTSISAVAYAVGFKDLSHFTRVFRRYAGVPPTRFLRNFTSA